MVFYYPVGDIETEASSLGFLSGGVERLEQVFFGVIVHTGSSVLDGDDELVVVGSGMNGNMVRCGWCFLCLDSVFDDVF